MAIAGNVAGYTSMPDRGSTASSTVSFGPSLFLQQ